MKMCDSCRLEFDDSVDLYPRLVVSKEAQVARKLAEEEDGEDLCLTCWLEAAQQLEPKQLATLLFNMLQKVQALQAANKPEWSDILEKMRERDKTQGTHVGPFSPGITVTNPWVTVKPSTTVTYGNSNVTNCSLSDQPVFVSGKLASVFSKA